jgi:hypothetical protein
MGFGLKGNAECKSDLEEEAHSEETADLEEEMNSDSTTQLGMDVFHVV